MGVRIGSRTIWLCSDCNRAAENKADEPEEEFDYACDVLDWHFASIPRSRLVTTIRQFPGHMRADVQTAVDRLFGNAVRLVGLDEEGIVDRATDADAAFGGQTRGQAHHLRAVGLHGEVAEHSGIALRSNTNCPPKYCRQAQPSHRVIHDCIRPLPELVVGLVVEQ